MAFKFPLQKVLEHRKITEDLAQRDFQAALGIYNQDLAALDSLNARMKSAYDEAFQVQHSKAGRASSELKQLHEFILGQKLRIESQKAKIQESENLVEACREILREKAMDYKIMERLKEKKKEEFVKEAEKKDQAEMDEISVLRKVHGDRA